MIKKTILIIVSLLLIPLYKSNALQLLENKEIDKVANVIEIHNKKLDTNEVYQLAHLIVKLTKDSNIPITFFLASIAQESNFNPEAKNKTSSAIGLGQIIPRYWVKFLGCSKEDFGNWKFNLQATVMILEHLKDRWGHRSDWPSFYYSQIITSESRINYYNSWKNKHNRIQRIWNNT